PFDVLRPSLNGLLNQRLGGEAVLSGRLDQRVDRGNHAARDSPFEPAPHRLSGERAREEREHDPKLHRRAARTITTEFSRPKSSATLNRVSAATSTTSARLHAGRKRSTSACGVTSQSSMRRTRDGGGRRIRAITRDSRLAPAWAGGAASSSAAAAICAATRRSSSGSASAGSSPSST